MSALGVLGGIGGGLMMAQKVLRDQKEDERRQKNQEHIDRQYERTENALKKNDEWDAERRAMIEASKEKRRIAEGEGYMPKQDTSGMTAPASIVARGISTPESKTPKYRDATQDDEFELVNNFYKRAIELGKWDDVGNLGKIRTGFMAEKLQNETKQRQEAARGVQLAFASRDNAKLQAALSSMSDLFPDGNDVKSARFLPDGNVEIAYGDSAPVAVPPGAVMQQVAALVSPEAALNVWHQGETRKAETAKTAWQQKNDDRDAKHKADTLAETKRNNIASEGILRIKADAEAKKDKAPSYKVEGSEVAVVLGDPAVDAKGRPIMDPMTGRQAVNRNQAREDQFYKWMAEKGITDTNEGLAKYKALPAGNAPAPASGKKNIDWSKY